MTETSKAKIPPDAPTRRCVEFARAVMSGNWALADSSERRPPLGATPEEVLGNLRATATEIDRILADEDLRTIPALSGGAS